MHLYLSLIYHIVYPSSKKLSSQSNFLLRRSRATQLGEVIKDYLAQYALQGKIKDHQAISMWHNLTGEAIQKVTQHIYLKENVLYVHYSSSIARNHVLMVYRQWQATINKHFGETVIKEVKLR